MHQGWESIIQINYNQEVTLGSSLSVIPPDIDLWDSLRSGSSKADLRSRFLCKSYTEEMFPGKT